MEDAGSKQFNTEKNTFGTDGVEAFERGNLYSAAMTVYEKIFEDLSVSWCEDNIDTLTNEIFTGDIILNLKNSGVNSDSDLAYITYLAALIGQAESCEDDEVWQFVDAYFEKLLLNTPEIYDYVSNEAKEIYNFDDEYINQYRNTGGFGSTGK